MYYCRNVNVLNLVAGCLPRSHSLLHSKTIVLSLQNLKSLDFSADLSPGETLKVYLLLLKVQFEFTDNIEAFYKIMKSYV